MRAAANKSVAQASQAEGQSHSTDRAMGFRTLSLDSVGLCRLIFLPFRFLDMTSAISGLSPHTRLKGAANH